MRNFLSVFIIATIFSIVAPAYTLDMIDNYVRIRSEANQYELQIAIRRFSLETGRPKVSLVGTIHFGERAYYERLQKTLNEAGHVLYEGCTSKDLKAIMSDLKHPSCENFESKFGGHRFEAMVTGLVAQVDNIQYDREHFKRSDESTEFLRELGGLSDPYFDCALLWSSFQNNPASKYGPLGVMFNMKRGMMILTGMAITPIGYDEVIVRRNLVVMRDLEALLKSGTQKEIAILYGAGHMADLEERLVGLGFRVVEEEWLTVMRSEGVKLSQTERYALEILASSLLASLSNTQSCEVESKVDFLFSPEFLRRGEHGELRGKIPLSIFDPFESFPEWTKTVVAKFEMREAEKGCRLNLEFEGKLPDGLCSVKSVGSLSANGLEHEVDMDFIIALIRLAIATALSPA